MDNDIIEGLISIGYDMHIHDLAGSYPSGLDREEWQKQAIEELLGRGEKATICNCHLHKGGKSKE